MTTLTFTAEQMQTLNDALVQLPFARVAPLITAINQQIAAQKQAEFDAAADKRAPSGAETPPDEFRGD